MTEANIGERGRGIRPPTLRTGEDATASRLELFFDLAYVLVVLELANAFYGDLSWGGFAVFVALYVAMWFSWVGFTLYANRFDTDDVVFRIAKLAATATIAGCAASASAATGEFSTPFALCFLAGRVILLLLLLRAWRHVPEARPTIAGLPGLHGGEHGAVGGVARLRRGRAVRAVGGRGRDGRPRAGDRHPPRGSGAPAHGAPARAVRAPHHPRARRGGRRRGDRGARREVDRPGRRRRASPGSSSPRRCGGTTSTSPPATARRSCRRATRTTARRARSPTSGTTCSSTAISRSRPGSSWPGSGSRTWWRTRSTPCRSDGGWTVAAGLALYLLGTGPDPRRHAPDVAGRVAVADGGDPGRAGRRGDPAPQRAAAGRRARGPDGGAHGVRRAARRPGAGRRR